MAVALLWVQVAQAYLLSVLRVGLLPERARDNGIESVKKNAAAGIDDRSADAPAP